MSEKLLYLLSAITSKLINLFGHVPKHPKKILVIKMDEIGDMVTALHVFDHLHLRYPNAEIHAQVKPFNTLFFKYIDHVTPVNELLGKYDLIVDLRGDYDSLCYALWNMPWYRVDRGSKRMRNKFSGGQQNELITNFQIIEELLPPNTTRLANKIKYSEAEKASVQEYLDSQDIRDFAVLHLGARDAARRWPIERYRQIIKYLNSKNISCLLVGGPSDKDINSECLSTLDQNINYNIAGRFDLLEFAALCANAKLFVGNESGPLHIAASEQIPIVALFGPGVKDVFYPIGDQVFIHHYFLDKGHKQQTIHNSTIFKISVDEVKASIEKILGFEKEG